MTDSDRMSPLFDVPEGAVHFGQLVGFDNQATRIDGGWQFSFTVRPEHLNRAGFCHGGMLLAMADHFFSMALMNETGFQRRMATASLNCDFVNGAKLGDLLTVRVSITRLTRSLGFVSGRIERDGEAILQGSGVWKFIGA